MQEDDSKLNKAERAIDRSNRAHLLPWLLLLQQKMLSNAPHFLRNGAAHLMVAPL